MCLRKLSFLLIVAGSASINIAVAQYPVTCADVSSRANSNGQTNSCPNVAATPYALNFVGTSYATVPATAKTGNLQLKYAGALSSLKPYAITKVWQTNPTTTVLPVSFGPASQPAVSGTDIVVNYCFYGNNLPAIGTLSLELTDPETGIVSRICSYDASCSANCVVVANPAALLPVIFSSFTGKEAGSNVLLNWTCDQEMNNKGFSIERSTDGSKFTAIAFIASRSVQGYSGIPVKYDFTDLQLPAGTNAWYRIRQVDLDGKSAYSALVKIDLTAVKQVVNIIGGNNAIIVVFPANSNAAPYMVTVYDVQGRIVHQKITEGTGRYMVNNLKVNTRYYITVTGKEKVYAKSAYLF